MTRSHPLSARSEWAFFLDIDGTLVDLAPIPGTTQVPETLPPLLDALGQHLGGALALISGRDLHDIDRLLPGGRDAAGTHGAQWRLGGAAAALTGFRAEDALRQAAREAARLPGVRVEYKAYAVAFHFRHALEQTVALRALARKTVESAPSPLRIQEGKMVLELLPADADKGGAIEHFLDRPPYRGRRPVFIGDDLPDESGFAAVNKRDGLSIHVGKPGTSLASRSLSSPRAVRRWLTYLHHVWKGARS